MRRLLFLLGGCVLSGAALAQTASPSDKPATDKPAATKAADKGGHDMGGMHAMHARMRPPTCVYEGKAYSKGALLVVRGVKPILECAAGEPPKAPPPTAAPAGDGGHAGHGGPPPLEWRVYRPGRAAAPAEHVHQH